MKNREPRFASCTFWIGVCAVLGCEDLARVYNEESDAALGHASLSGGEGGGSHLDAGVDTSAETLVDAGVSTSPEATNEYCTATCNIDDSGSSAAAPDATASTDDGSVPSDAYFDSGTLSSGATAYAEASVTSSRFDAGPVDGGPSCGDGVVDSDELCDPTHSLEGSRCDADCTWRVTAVVAGRDHTCALTGNGDVKCWGSNAKGQLGLGEVPVVGLASGQMGSHLPRVDLGNFEVTALTAGETHTCALSSDGLVKCWGADSDGRLGYDYGGPQGDQASEMGEDLATVDLGGQALAVAAGSSHTCALLWGGKITCWGDNTYGQLGFDRIDEESGGTAPNPMGTHSEAVELGEGRHALKVTAGFYHTCALLNDGAVQCWGQNGNGQRGLDNREQGFGPVDPTDARSADAKLGNVEATDVVAGGYHTCVILEDQSVKCWGKNLNGQLGLDDTIDRGMAPGQMEALGAVPLGSTSAATRLALGESHTCVLQENDKLRCWGSDQFGQLGINDKTKLELQGDVGDSENEMAKLVPVEMNHGHFALDVATGAFHTCSILNTGRLKCWGLNATGQLGLEDDSNRGERVGDMSALPVVDLF